MSQGSEKHLGVGKPKRKTEEVGEKAAGPYNILKCLINQDSINCYTSSSLDLAHTTLVVAFRISFDR